VVLTVLPVPEVPEVAVLQVRQEILGVQLAAVCRWETREIQEIREPQAVLEVRVLVETEG
jgi:hypothetical protein